MVFSIVKLKEFDTVLAAVGRSANTKKLNLEKLNVLLNK